MSTSEIIHTLIAHTFASSDSSFKKRGLSPVRDWLIGVFVFLMLLIAGGIVSAYRFMQYIDISVTTESINQKSVSYNKVAVAEALRIYGAKKSEFVRLAQDSQAVPIVFEVIPDPVLPISTSTEVIRATGSVPVVEMAN